MIEIFVFWLVLAIVVGVIAGSRNRNGFGWFILALVISPLIAGILVLALGSSGKACPQCAEKVQPAAKVCKHCGHQFGAPKPSPADLRAAKTDAILDDIIANPEKQARTRRTEPNLNTRDEG